MTEPALTTTLITLIVATVELVVCLACAVVLWRKRRERPDHSRLMLALGAAHCVVTSLLKYVHILTSPAQHLYHEALSPASVKYGLLSTLLLLGYGVSVVRPEWFRSWRGVLAYLSPGLAVMVAFGLVPSWHVLHTFGDVCRYIGEPDVWIRAVQYPVIVGYCLALLFGLVNIRQTGVGSLWVRSYILGALGLLTLVSASSLFHVLALHYVHQVCVAAYFGYWTYYELYDRTYSAPMSEAVKVNSEKPAAALPSAETRFMNFDARVDRERLYTRPDLSRDDYARLMGVDRTTFSRIIATQSGCQNLSAYLNRKRMAEAVRLMRQHPNYTLQAIMEDSGYRSKMTFNRVFKDTYGTTPSEYRQTLA